MIFKANEKQAVNQNNNREELFLRAFPVDYLLKTAELRSLVREEMNNCGIVGNNAEKALLAMTEVITNINRHATDKGSGLLIKLRWKNIEDGALEIDIADTSVSFLTFEVELRKSQMRLNNGQHESGLGLAIISQLFPDVAYRPMSKSLDGMNHTTFSFSLEGGVVAKKKEIVIVDDDASVRELLKTFLKSHYDVVAFESAKEALSVIIQKKPALIISDLHMGEMDGMEFRKQLNEIDGGMTIPFIFLSGDKRASEKPYLNRLGIDDFLFKPIHKDALKNVVERLIHRTEQLNMGIKDAVGKDITALLKPKLPDRMGNWKVNLYNEMAEHGGGDFVLHHKTATGDIIVMADVMGKGTQAKFFSCAYAGYFRSFFKFAVQDNDKPDEIFRSFSSYIINDELFNDVILTGQIVHLAHDGTLSVASAGHPFPHYYNAELEKAQRIEISGTMPGLSLNPVYRNHLIKMNYGDAFFMHTDGFGEIDDKTAIIERATEEGIDSAFDNVIADLKEMSENGSILGNRDDRTIIMITYNG